MNVEKDGNGQHMERERKRTHAEMGEETKRNPHF